MILTAIYLVIGIVVVVVGADYFIASSSLIAKRFGIPKLIIGLTIIAIGTSAPEFGVNIISSIQGHNELALGNVLGSNIANILFVFAGAVLFSKKIEISKNSLTQISLGLLISVLVLCAGYFSFGANIPKEITQFEGLFFLIGGLFYWLYLYKITKANTERLESEDLEENKLRKIESLALIIGIMIVSLAGLLYGSTLVTNGAVAIAHLLGISELVIAGTVIAIGTSLPELVTSIQAIRQKQYNLMVGTIIGSNIVNTLFILGTSTVIHSVVILKDGLLYLIVNVVAAMVLLICFTLFEPRVFKRWQAAVLFALYIGFLIANIR